ncbi:MAG TPA: hypothetical protein VFT74_00040, partial [Isosphaeraceae bacterium]|nr:hypothetical protein [Isosphaeraceae bacterium]
MSNVLPDRLTRDDLIGRLRAVEPRLFLVPERLIRRIVRRRMPGGSLGLIVPHRKGVLVSESELVEVDAFDELAPEAMLQRGHRRPFLLLVEPDESDLEERDASSILREYWRLLFHARIHEYLDQVQAAGRLPLTEVQSRIHRIGEVEFDEIRSVLSRERLLLPPVSDPSTYIEFAAIFLELRAFAPELICDYFPGIDDTDRVAAMLREQIDPEELLEQTRPQGFAAPPYEPSRSYEEPDEATLTSPADELLAEPYSNRRYQAQMTRADRVEAVGNLVRGSILRTRAARSGSRTQAGQANSSARDALNRLANRLQEALGLDDGRMNEWRLALRSLREPAAVGKWPAAARLLYDLQAVCIDHEREIYKIDLIEWMLSFGRRSLKRLLPNQREVAECKHLRLAIRHLGRAAISDADRNRLSRLLHDVLDEAEERVRERFRPLIGRALERGGLVPANPPERVAYGKMAEELLDLVVERGYLTAGDLRDAISRNALKLPD